MTGRVSDSGTAMLTGGIVNDQDTLVKFDVEMYFEMEENAADGWRTRPVRIDDRVGL